MRSLGLLASALSLCGCATLQNVVQRPALSFERANLAAISLGGATLDVVFKVDNPNPIGLSIDQINTRFLIDGKQLVASSPPGGLALPANGSTELRLPLTFRFVDVAETVLAFLTKQQANYRLEGDVGVRTPSGLLRVPLAVEGRFDVPKMPSISIETPRIRELSLSQATIELPIRVHNPNGLPLLVDGLQGNLQMDGSSLGSLNLDQVGTLEAGQTKELVAPITINLGQSVAVARAISRGHGNLALTGQVSSKDGAIPIDIREELALRR
jgi:LEA14-like dessication related protein